MIEESLKDTVQVMSGIRHEDKNTKDTFESIQANMTPKYWLIHSYPSFGTMTIFILNLKDRIEYLNKYVIESNKGKDVRKFKLGYFYDQRAFFTTL